MKMFSSLRAVAAVAAAAACAVPSVAAGQLAPDGCRVGVYRSPRNVYVSLMKAENGFNYTFHDGRMGNTASPRSRVRCAVDAVVVTLPDSTSEIWPQAPLRMTPTTFQSDGVALAGLLVEPLGVPGRPPLVVMSHGSGKEPWVGGEVHWPFTLAAEGVASFVYDKRGTGQSGGEFTMSLRQLSRDLVAASAEARRLAGDRMGRLGLYGMSQGGWVAPLAAREAGAEFMAVGFGPAYSPLEEDEEEVIDDLRARGYGDEVIANARRVARATAAVLASGFQGGYDELSRMKQAYGNEPWFGEIEGEFTGAILRATEAELRVTGRATYDNLGLEWSHDAMAVLRTLDLPQLWVLGGSDEVMPPRLTLERLAQLRGEGKPVQVAVFPGADHQMLEFVQQADGSRRYTRATDGVYRLLGDWMKGCLAPPYGTATLEPPVSGSSATCD